MKAIPKDETPASVPRVRSPNYPVTSLKYAMDYLEKLASYSKGHRVPMDAAITEVWRMKPNSAYGRQVVAALKAFGLIEDSGSGEKRHIRITDAAAKIRGNHSDRAALLATAALCPPLHQELWDRFSSDGEMPPSVTLRQYLVFDRDGARFNESTVDSFIDEFLETLAFAKLGVDDKIDGEGAGEDDKEDEDSDSKRRQLNTRRRNMSTAVKGDVYTLSSGDCVLSWPERISSDEYSEIEDWLGLMRRKLKRSVIEDTDTDGGDAGKENREHRKITLE